MDKLSKLEKTGDNIVKLESSKRALSSCLEDFNAQNRLLLLELPQFYEKRVDYFQPCLQALVQVINMSLVVLIILALNLLFQAQVDYYGESTTLFTNLVPAKEGAKTDKEYKEDVDKAIAEIRALSIVGN